MNALVWQLRQWIRRLGVGGSIGIGLLVAALLLQSVQVAAARRAVAQQQDRLDALHRSAAARQAEPAPHAFNPLAMLPPTGTAARQIGEIEQLAHAHGIDLPRGQYNVSPQTGTPLARWQLVLPVDAPYPDLHAFLAAALERLPNLTLDELKLKRERIEDTALQAELRMSLFVETAP